MELPDDIAHINYNKIHAKYVLFVLSPVLIAGFRWVHRANFLVRQGEKAIASTLQTAKHSLKKKVSLRRKTHVKHVFPVS